MENLTEVQRKLRTHTRLASRKKIHTLFVIYNPGEDDQAVSLVAGDVMVIAGKVFLVGYEGATDMMRYIEWDFLRYVLFVGIGPGIVRADFVKRNSKYDKDIQAQCSLYI